MAKLFIGGIVPGLVMALFLSLFIIIRVLINPALAPEAVDIRATWTQRFTCIGRIWHAWILILLVLGGFMVVPSLDYAATSLNASRIVKQNLNGVYAADAGVEYVLRSIRNSISPLPEQPPANINGLEVTIETENKAEYALYYGKFVATGGKYYYLAVEKEVVWVEEADAYRYTITVTLQPEADRNVELEEVGARLPVGYVYEPDSADDDDFADNLSDAEPSDTLDGAGAHMLNWMLPPPHPTLKETGGPTTASQAFYITGSGELEGDYAWVVSARDVVSTVSEAVGTLYSITATATRPGDSEVIAEVTADVLWYSGASEMNTILWQTNPQ